MLRLTSRVAPSSLASCRFFSASSANRDKIGFIGLGNMGAGMANNLMKNGHELVVYDLNTEAVDRFVANGAKGVSTPAGVCDATDVTCVVTMLPNSQIVQGVYKDLFPLANKGTLFIDSSTIDPHVAKELAQEAKESGFEAVDAPVSGGVPRANDGTLTFMVGGEDDVEPRARKILECMGANIVHCGANSTGQVVKLCNNLSLGIQMVGMSESMNLGIKLGMDAKKMAGIFNTATSRCWSSDSYNPVPGVMEGVPSSRGYTGGFGVDLMAKDLGLALNAAENAGVISPLGAVASSVYKQIQEEGHGGKDFSFSYQWLKSKNQQ